MGQLGRVGSSIEAAFPEGALRMRVVQQYLMLDLRTQVRGYSLKTRQWELCWETGRITQSYAWEEGYITADSEGSCHVWGFSQAPPRPVLCHSVAITALLVYDGLLYTGSKDKAVKSFALRDYKVLPHVPLSSVRASTASLSKSLWDTQI